ncbi:hypothetical protein ABIB62_000635 [Mucilaginibacter sp. UYP25]|uniref:hypothetical protein n=1 Tax=unclassified Mucilaginibacter TaxID=2617802 RepID=UPI0033965B07
MSKIVLLSGNPEERKKQLEELKKTGVKTLDGGPLPIGTHLFTVSGNDIWGTKKAGGYDLMTVAGVLTNSDTGEKVTFNNSEDSKKLVVPSKFRFLIEPNKRLYLTIEFTKSGWKSVTNVVTA